jgi:hypothetical protein
MSSARVASLVAAAAPASGHCRRYVAQSCAGRGVPVADVDANSLSRPGTSSRYPFANDDLQRPAERVPGSVVLLHEPRFEVLLEVEF